MILPGFKPQAMGIYFFLSARISQMYRAILPHTHTHIYLCIQARHFPSTIITLNLHVYVLLCVWGGPCLVTPQGLQLCCFFFLNPVFIPVSFHTSYSFNMLAVMSV